MTLDAENYHNQPDLLEERLSAYLDGMLDTDERAQLEEHLVDCETCQEQLAQLRQVRALVRALPQPALPRSFLLPVEEAPAPAASAASHAKPIQLQIATTRQRAARIARAAQWLGAVAAVLGLALLISTAVLGSRGAQNSAAATFASDSGGSTAAQSPNYNDSPQPEHAAATATARSAMGAHAHETPPGAVSGTNGSKSAGGSQNPTASPQAPPLFELQIGAASLLVAGALLLVIGSVSRRRSARA